MVIYFIYYFFVYLFGFLLLFAGVVLFLDFIIRSRGYSGPKSDHFDGIEFFTPGHYVHDRTFEHGHGKLFWKWVLRKPKNHWKYQKSKFRTVPERIVISDRISVTFIGHSTVLLQTMGLNIITDPVFSKRIGPDLLPFAKFRRYKDPGVKISDLPKIDLILLSHNHYDHMDLKSLRYISVRDNPKILTSLGNSEYLRSHRVKGATDMDWWDKEVINPDITVCAVPAQHFAARAITDRNNTLWCGFVIETPMGNIYFAGDSGYSKLFSHIAEKYNNFILGLVPIGSYKPEWFMSPMHMTPYEAIKVHEELRIKTSIAIHFGTFKLADDGQDEAKDIIKKVVAESTMKKLDFRVLETGQSVVI